MATPVAQFPFNYNIPTVLLGTNGISNNFGQNQLCNITLVNSGGGNAVLTVADNSGTQRILHYRKWQPHSYQESHRPHLVDSG